MNRAERLMQRRTMLVAECALQRSTLIAQGRQLGINTGWMKSGAGMFERFQHLPSWASVLLAAAVAIMPGRVAGLARSGLMLWQFWRNLKSATDTKSTN
jgi:hypothetical protein